MGKPIQRFSRKFLVVVVGVFTVFMVTTAIVRAVSTIFFETEKCTLSTTSVQVKADTSASGGAYI